MHAQAILVYVYCDFILELQNENTYLNLILYMLSIFKILLEIFLERKCRNFRALTFSLDQLRNVQFLSCMHAESVNN